MVYFETGTAEMELSLVGPRQGADRDDPQVSAKVIFQDDSVQVGVWECTPGGWPIVDRGDTEVATIVGGKGTITDADGTEQVLAWLCGDSPQRMVWALGPH